MIFLFLDDHIETFKQVPYKILFILTCIPNVDGDPSDAQAGAKWRTDVCNVTMDAVVVNDNKRQRKTKKCVLHFCRGCLLSLG